MACWPKPLWKLLAFLLVSNLQPCANGKPQVPCFFIFGDSLSDSGNNNNLATLAKATYPPYGIDFPKGITGRFTNGRNLVDFIAELLGFDNYIPPFANARGQEILQGVNYASGGAGIRSESGQMLGDRISMDRQLKNHRTTVSRMIDLLGNQNSTTDYLSKCIYSVEIGINDYANNYFSGLFYPTSRLYTPSQYAEVLIQQLSQQLMTLYKHGARKVAIFGVGLLGCTPFEVSLYGRDSSGCVNKINDAVQLYNDRLKSLVADLNNNLTNANFIFINSTGISLRSSQGPTVTDVPCCQLLEGSAQCIPFGNSCSNKSQYPFWDAIHPTEVIFALIAEIAYKAQSPTDAYPFDIKYLAQL